VAKPNYSYEKRQRELAKKKKKEEKEKEKADRKAGHGGPATAGDDAGEPGAEPSNPEPGATGSAPR
jgi:hypothetical protein